MNVTYLNQSINAEGLFPMGKGFVVVFSVLLTLIPYGKMIRGCVHLSIDIKALRVIIALQFQQPTAKGERRIANHIQHPAPNPSNT